MKHLLAVIFLSAMLTSFGQEIDSIPAVNFAAVDKFPVFPGCDETASNETQFNCMASGIIRHISKNFKYPKKARKKGLEGKVYVNFVIEKDGRITNVEIARGVHKSLDDECVRVVKCIPTFDAPAYVDGEAVRMQYTVPINAKL